MEFNFSPSFLQEKIRSHLIKECLNSTLENIQLSVDLSEEDLTYSGKVDVSLLNFSEYIEENLSGVKIITIDMDVTTETSSGKLYMFLDARIALILSGVMMMIPEAAILEKLESLEVTESDLEVLYEIGNILAGHYDEFIRSKSNKEELKILINKVINHTDLNSLDFSDGVLFSEELIYSKTEDNYYTALFFDEGISNELWNLDFSNQNKEIEQQNTDEAINETNNQTIKPSVLVIQELNNEPENNIKFYIQSDFNVHLVKNIGEVKDVLGKERISLILLDASISVPGGITIGKWIRAMSMTSKIPIVAFSNGTTKNMVLNALKNGAVDFIPLPWDKNKIIQKIKSDVEVYTPKSVL